MFCGEVGSGMTICGLGNFLGFVGIGLVAGSTLGFGVSFTEDLEFWFLCVAVLSLSTLGYPHVFTLRGLHVL